MIQALWQELESLSDVPEESDCGDDCYMYDADADFFCDYDPG